MSTAKATRGHVGVVVKHRARCATHDVGGRRCTCRPAYMAHVWSAKDRRRIGKTVGSLADAKSWRADMHGALRRGSIRTPTKTTVREAAGAWLAGVADGTIVNRRRQPYKPSAVRSYEHALRLRRPHWCGDGPTAGHGGNRHRSIPNLARSAARRLGCAGLHLGWRRFSPPGGSHTRREAVDEPRTGRG